MASQELVDQMASMGYPRELAKVALAKSRNRMEDALNVIEELVAGGAGEGGPPPTVSTMTTNSTTVAAGPKRGRPKKTSSGAGQEGAAKKGPQRRGKEEVGEAGEGEGEGAGEGEGEVGAEDEDERETQEPSGRKRARTKGSQGSGGGRESEAVGRSTGPPPEPREEERTRRGRAASSGSEQREGQGSSGEREGSRGRGGGGSGGGGGGRARGRAGARGTRPPSGGESSSSTATTGAAMMTTTTTTTSTPPLASASASMTTMMATPLPLSLPPTTTTTTTTTTATSAAPAASISSSAAAATSGPTKTHTEGGGGDSSGDNNETSREEDSSSSSSSSSSSASRSSRRGGGEGSSAESGNDDSDCEVYYMSDDGDGDEDGEQVVGSVPLVQAAKDGYIVLSPAQIRETQVAEIMRIKDIFHVPATVARQLLQHFGWECERLVERFYGGDADAIYRQAGVAPPAAGGSGDDSSTSGGRGPDTTEVCGVCRDEFVCAAMSGLPCGHLFCTDCWNSYLRVMIMDGNATRVRCPAQKCGLLVDELTIMKLLVGDDMKARFDLTLARTFVKDHPYMRWCPAAGCENAVKATVSRTVTVHCTCGHRFCFNCGEGDHRPAHCDMVRDWSNKLKDDSETNNWLALYTKECPNPKCRATINKDEGCQYMTCGMCRHKFCWICCGAFDHKKHNCNEYKDTVPTSMTAVREALNKFNFFFTRYSLHAHSLTLESRLRSRVEASIAETQVDAWVTTQYLTDALDTLKDSRNALKNSYIYGYYLPSSVNRVLFEYLQGEFEEAVERLSQILEAKDGSRRERRAVIDLSSNVKRRLENLLDGLAKGEIEGGANTEPATYDGPAKIEYSGWIYNAAN